MHINSIYAKSDISKSVCLINSAEAGRKGLQIWLQMNIETCLWPRTPQRLGENIHNT